MSSRIRHILLQHEETPPSGNWEKICRELDDAGAGFRFPETLYGLSVTPSAGNWESINSALDEEALSGTVAEKLYHVQVPVPAAAWTQIVASLDAKPSVRRPAAWLKYAGAAILIGVLTFSASRIFRQPSGTSPVMAGQPVQSLPESVSHEQINTAPVPVNGHLVKTQAEDEQEAREDAALEASKQTYARLDLSNTQKAEIAAAFRFDENSPAGSDPAQEGERYVLLMNPDGHFIRMSKKLTNLLCCVSGEEQDKDCRSMVDNWRKQLACSNAAHPGNFMDILNLVSSLQEQ